MQIARGKRLIIRNATNIGGKAKTTYTRIVSPGMQPSLFISRLVQVPASDNKAINMLLDGGWKMIRTFRGNCIAEKQFAIQDESLVEVFLKLYTNYGVMQINGTDKKKD